MKNSEKMFDYGNNKYRFISDEKLEIGDEVKITDKVYKPIVEIVEQRPDKGKWKVPKITQDIIV